MIRKFVMEAEYVVSKYVRHCVEAASEDEALAKFLEMEKNDDNFWDNQEDGEPGPTAYGNVSDEYSQRELQLFYVGQQV